MTTYEDGLLAARFSALAPEPRVGDWEDVLARAGQARPSRRPFANAFRSRRRRRLAVLAAVALVVVVGAASALALRACLNVGIIGLAPVGSTPSTPEKGELVFSFGFGHTFGDHGRFRINVYADGRMITSRLGDHTQADEYSIDDATGLLERRLSPEGVALVRAEVVSTGLVEHDLFLQGGEGLYYGHIDFRDGGRAVRVLWGDIHIWGWGEGEARERATPEQASALVRLDRRLADPVSWLPASAWVDPETKAYVPSAYAVCLEGQKGLELSRVLALLPPRAEDLLRTQKNIRGTYTNLVGTFVYWCSRLTNDEARALERILDDAGVQGRKDTSGLAYGVPDIAYATATEFSLTVNPLLPDEKLLQDEK